MHIRHFYQSTIILLDKQSQTACIKENHERIFFSNMPMLVTGLTKQLVCLPLVKRFWLSADSLAAQKDDAEASPPF